MQERNAMLPAADAGGFDLGMMQGSRRAFASVAGRCSASDVECPRRRRQGDPNVHRAAIASSATWKNNAVVWLCADRASFITGHALPVDGGFVAR